jgi:hypothetical protein
MAHKSGESGRKTPLEPTVGLEPTTCALRVRRSTAELCRLPSKHYTRIYPQQRQLPQPALGVPISSSVWNDEPHPQPCTAFGLSILKPPPNMSST